jgi:hypothetical protein
LVTILTPSYNQVRWLGDNLASVASQTYRRIEHIVMDGGSTDGSVELLRASGESVTWASEPDNGQADAINKAFARSHGEIIGWINSDDAYFDRDVVADVVAFFQDNPEIDVVYGHGAQIGSDGIVVQILWAPRFDSELLHTLSFITQPAAFFRRSALRDPMLDESFHFTMDYELWLRLEHEGRRFARIDRITGIDRLQPLRKSSTITDVHESDLLRLSRTYGVYPTNERQRARTLFYLKQRLAGALQIPRIPRELGFTTPEQPLLGLWKRQLFSRRSTWPAEYR